MLAIDDFNSEIKKCIGLSWNAISAKLDQRFHMFS